MSRHLLAERRFAPLFACQFLSAFGDNFLRNALGLLVVWSSDAAPGWIVAAASGAFVLPSVLLSGLGGQLADRMDKARLTATGRVAAFGQIFEWLYQHHRTVQASRLDRSPFLWDGIASEMVADGVVSINGAPPNRVSANRAWRHVTRYLAQEAEDRKARLAERGHRSRRTKGWVPPSSAPAEPQPVPAGPRRDTTPHPHVVVAAPAAPASPAAPPRTVAAPRAGRRVRISSAPSPRGGGVPRTIQ